MNFIVSEKNAQHGLLLVITDEEIIGKKFEQGNLQLDLTSNFYKGDKKSEEEVKELISKAKHLHLTGKNSVALGVSLELVNGENILIISDIPHAEVVFGN